MFQGCRSIRPMLFPVRVRASRFSTMKRHSETLTRPDNQGVARSFMYGLGLDDEDLQKPQVGIAACWQEGNPCNMHLDDLSKQVKEGVTNSGLVGFRFNTISVSDILTMGNDGMRYSLPSRDLIADSIESLVAAQHYDGVVTIAGCDKNMPGCIMAMARLDRPGLMVYGGSILPGCRPGKNEEIDVGTACATIGELQAGKITEEEREEIIRHCVRGPGSCAGMYTANTMSTCIEVMGMSLPYSSSMPANDKAKMKDCSWAGRTMKKLIHLDLRPKDIMTWGAFENALKIIMVLGGSTNACIHLIAMAKSVGVHLTLDDIQAISDQTPYLADIKPTGKYYMKKLNSLGGTPALMKYLLEEGILDGSQMTVTGTTIEENLQHVKRLSSGQDLVRKVENPLKKTGHINILYGNLAPEGAVAKLSGKEGTSFIGKARVYDSERQMLQAFENGDLTQNRKRDEKLVVVIRYEGPRGGPGMPEMLYPTSAIMGANLGTDVALITDGRFSGASKGFIIGHITPEAQSGGNIALVQDGDTIEIDGDKNKINMLVTDEELKVRRDNWVAPPLRVQKGVLYRYAKCVSSATTGCVTDEL